MTYLLRQPHPAAPSSEEGWTEQRKAAGRPLPAAVQKSSTAAALGPTPRTEIEVPDRFFLEQLRDRVTIMSLFEQVVNEEQIKAAWFRWQRLRRQGEQLPLWRALLLDPVLDRDNLYRVAAKVYAFEEARIVEPRAFALFKDIAEVLSREQLEHMLRLSMLPVSVEKTPDGSTSLVFATYDPLRPEASVLLQQFLQQFGLGRMELRYAPESVLTGLIHHWRSQKELSKLESLRDSRWTLGLPSDATEGGSPSRSAPASGTDEAAAEKDFLGALFDHALAAAVAGGATDTYFLSDRQGNLAVFHQRAGHLQRWPVEEKVSLRTMIAYVEADLLNLSAFQSGAACDGILSRPVNGAPTDFWFSVEHPAEADDPSTACIRIRMLP